MGAERLERHNVEDILALSPMQEGILFQCLKRPELYLEQFSLRLSGIKEPMFMYEAWHQAVQANEMLRTIFRWKGMEDPIQIVLKHLELSLERYNLCALGEEEKANAAAEIKQRELNGIDLESCTFKVAFIEHDTDRTEMIMTYHHILFDGWSSGILLKEVFSCYNALICGQAPEIPFKSKYKQFIVWGQSQKQHTQEIFWRSYLEGAEAKLLPKKIQSGEASSSIAKLTYQYPDQSVEEILSFTRRHNITLASLVYTAWGILLQRYHNSDDVLFGVTASGRPPVIQDVENMIGLFINTFPVRLRIRPEEQALELVRKVNKDLLDLGEYQQTPLSQIHAYGGVQGGDSLFDTVLVIENYPITQTLEAGSCNILVESCTVKESSNFDLLVEVIAFSGLEVHLCYNEHAFEEDFARSMLQHLTSMLGRIVSSPEVSACRLNLLSEAENERLLYQFNDTDAEYPNHRTIHGLFEEQVIRGPEQVALICGETRMTYAELEWRASRLADRLVRSGVRANTVVGIMADYSCETVIGMLAVMKAGGAYLPLDPAYPAERIAFMVRDSGTRFLLTPPDIAMQMEFEGLVIAITREMFQEIPAESDFISATDASALAYIIYTSGSTGQPAGVMVQHKAVVNTLHWRKGYYGLDAQSVVLQLTSFSFDSSIESVYTTLLSGGSLILVTQDQKLNSEYIGKVIMSCGVSHFLTVPDYYKMLLEQIPRALQSVESITIGGEQVLPEMVEEHFRKANSTRLFNEYGPTENSITATVYEFQKEEVQILIGKPIYNTSCYILDRFGNLQPIGIPGELCISGTGLAMGYLNRGELEQERFVHNPFVMGTRMYRTGDLARWLPNGEIAYLGRLDHQVKIRGHRVEAGEVESWLAKWNSVQQSAVITRNNAAGLSCLHAFIVSDIKMDTNGIKHFLSTKLPEYMIPYGFTQLEALPYLPNGKIDRKALVRMELPDQAATDFFTPPQNELEEQLAMIWKKVLRLERVSVKTAFFDLGGNSLLLMRVFALIDKEYPDRVKVVDLFTYPSIRKLADYILHGASVSYVRRDDVAFNMPSSFFTSGDFRTGANYGQVMRYTVPQPVYSVLEQAAKREECEVVHVLLTAYLHIFALLSKNRRIFVQALISEPALVTSVDVQFDGENEFTDLLHTVRNQTEFGQQVMQYRLGSITGTGSEKGTGVIPLFYDASLLNFETSFLETYDFAMGVHTGTAAGQATLIMRYNHQRIKEDKAKNLMNNYDRYLQIIADKYLNYIKEAQL